jgi:hypothetical protein
MNAKPTFFRPHAGATVAAAALSAVVATALLAGVTGMFQRSGTPFGQIVTAEHACAHHVFIAERETCLRAYATADAGNAASRWNSAQQSVNASARPSASVRAPL